MNIFTQLVFFIAGLALLIKSADELVDGSSYLASKFKIPPLVIGMTIIAFGTSAPELVFNVSSALSGMGGTQVALGNIIGSNIANILLVLGAAGLFYPLTVESNTIWKEIPMSFLAAFMVAVLGLSYLLDPIHFDTTNGAEIVAGTGIQLPGFNSTDVVGYLSVSSGLILLSFFAIFLYYTLGIAQNSDEDDLIDLPEMKNWRAWLGIIGGLVGLTLGGKIAADGAVNIAELLNVSSNLIGLTIAAIGTSFPELVTSIRAAMKKQTDIAVGNVVGSNVFNLLLVLPITSMIAPVPITGQNALDIIVLLAVTIWLMGSVYLFTKHKLGKIEAGSMLTMYVVYMIFVVWRG